MPIFKNRVACFFAAMAFSASALAVNVVTNGSFEGGLTGWTIAPATTNTGATCGFNGAVPAPGTETGTATPGFPATAGTDNALGRITGTVAGRNVCALYQDVFIPVGASTANLTADSGVKMFGGAAQCCQGTVMGLFPTTSVGMDISPKAAGSATYRNPAVSDAVLAPIAQNNINVIGIAGTTVRLQLMMVSTNTTGFAVGGFDNVVLDVTVPTYSVTYDGNTSTGGSVPVDGTVYVRTNTVTVLGNSGTLVKAGYAFAGWNTAADGSGTSRAPASTFAMGSANVTLYAQWTLAPVNGACGSANGASSPFAPTANLCTTGSASGVTSGAGTYSWSCNGSGGGTTAACSAPWQAAGSGTGTATVVNNGWVFAPQGNGALQTAGFIPVSGHPKSPPSVPAGISFPYGLFDFVLTTGTPGSSATITITYPTAVPAGAIYWKYGPTPAGNNCSGAACAVAHWYQFPAVFAGNTATLTITDGGLGDDDLTANGVIVDQGGPGLPASSTSAIPTLSEWARMLLAAILAMMGMLAVRRRCARG